MAKKVIKIILLILLLIVLAAAAFFAYITLSEYKPDDRENLEVAGVENIFTGGYYGQQLQSGQKLRIATWNVGYGALGETADFFMDGGESVKTADEAGVKENISAVSSAIKDMDADIYFLQEVDRDSARSSNINEEQMLLEDFGTEGTSSSFAYNFKTPFVPYPMPPIGKVESGILTISEYNIVSAQRVSLPCPFKWPVRAVNLKRCLMIDRIPMVLDQENFSTHELVLINLHLEAYDDGEGKAAQTKMLKTIMDEEAAKGNYVIVGGDFNQTFSTVDMDAYPVHEGMWLPGKIDTDEFGGDWQFLMDEKAPTCRSLDKAYAGADKDDFQYYMIDGFIVSDNIKVNKVSTKQLDFKNSDHNPVVIDIELK